jgi:transcriptional regulator with XRE-family HTH domain
VPRRTRADPLSRKLGEAIRATREERGETLDQVAHRIPRMDAKYLGEIERGWHSPTIPTVKRIANALDTGLSDLFKGL